MSDDAGWAACLADLAAAAERLAGRVGDGRAADLAVKQLGAVMGAYLTHLWAEPDHPAFLPSVGYHQMYGTPNPDTVYRSAAVDGRGRYLLSGVRGTAPDATLMPFGRPAAGGVQTFAPLDLDDLRIGTGGTFEVEIGGDGPTGDRDWWPLEPGTRSLMLRSVSERWGEEADPRVAIVRLDAEPHRRRTDVDVLRAKLRSYAAVVEGMVLSGLARAEAIRAAGANRLAPADYAAAGARPDQRYHEGWFDLADGECLLLEVELPVGVTGFSLGLTDAHLSTVDWAGAQSSLNGVQAPVDSDAVLRAAVAAADPGVRNWLDTTGHRAGVLQCRWTGGDVAPQPTVRLVDAGDLPAVMPRANARERAATICARQQGVQLRCRW